MHTLETDKLINKSESNPNPDLGRPESAYSDLSGSSTKSALTYKNMSDAFFFTTALVLHSIILGLSISITNIDDVFDYAGAVGSSSMMFLFPGLTYILALQKYGTPSHRQLWSTFFWHALAWFFLLCYVAILFAFFYVELGKRFGSLAEEVLPEGIEEVLPEGINE